MLTFILGGCGTGKSTDLMNRMQKDIENGVETLVLVPEQFSFEAEKKLYAFLGVKNFNRIRTFSFATLSRELLGLYGSDNGAERYASDHEKLVFLYQSLQNTLRRGDLRVLDKKRDSSVFIEELYSLVVKLRRAGVTSRQLLDASVMLPDRLSDKTADVAMLLLEYERILHEHSLCDRLNDLTEAAAAANIHDYFKGKSVYLDEFDTFSGDQYGMLDVILSQAENVCISIRTDEPDAKISTIFEGGNRTFRSLLHIAKNDYRIPVETVFCKEYRRSSHSDLYAVSTQILRPGKHCAPYNGHVHLFEASDPVMEAEYIGSTICRMLSEDDTLHCSDIAIAVSSFETYAPILQRAFDRFNLPYHLSAPAPILHTEPIRYFLSLLAILSDHQWDTEALLCYLKNPFSGYDAIRVSMLEHYCFTWSIEKNDWLHPFYGEDPTLSERAEPFGGQKLEELRSTLIGEIRKLKRECREKSVREICQALYQHMLRQRKLFEKTRDTQDILENRRLTTIWNLLMEIFDTIVSCCGDEVLDLLELHDLFRLMITDSSFSTPPQTLDSIQIVESSTVRLNDPKIVFVPGVAENSFPSEIKIGGMFTRQELEQLSDNGITISKLFFELYSDERLIVHKILSAPTQQLFLSCPAVNAAGEVQYPSTVIHQIRKLFPDAQELITKESQLPLHYFVRTPASAYFHFVRSLRSGKTEISALQSILEADPVYSVRVKKLVKPVSSADYRVSPETMQQRLGDCVRLSPSGIERFYSCPFQYFCKDCLRLFSPEKNAFSDNHVGNFAHFCFEQILRKYSVEQFTELTAAQLTQEIHTLSDQFSEAVFSDAVKRDVRFRLNYRMAGGGLLKILQHMQREMQHTDFVPLGFEVPVGSSQEDGTIPPLVLREGSVLCGGKIDRVDLCEKDGKSILRVIDYKTGNRVFEPEKLDRGLDMQMLIYLKAVKDSGVYENPVAGGVLYMPSGQLKLKHYHDRDKNADAAEIFDEYYRMKGLLLEDTAHLMEPEVTENGAPVLSSAKSELYTVDAQQMERLDRHVTQKICGMADALYQGQIAPDPYLNLPCGYCGYHDLCDTERQPPRTLRKAERLEAIEAVFGEPQENSDNTEEKEESAI